MKNLYFNTHEFNHAKALIPIHPVEAKVAFQRYLEKYPKDYVAQVYYASNFIMLRQLDEASGVIKNVEFEAFHDNTFIHYKNQKMFNAFRRILTFTKVRILFYQGKYQELYNNYFDISDEVDINTYLNFDINFFNYNPAIFYCKKKLGMLPQDLTIYTYLFRQIYDYHEEDFLEHIKKHISGCDVEQDSSSTSLFRYDFNIRDIIEEIKHYIPSERGIYFGLLEDIYIFKYDSCDWCNHRTVNYFKVVCFHDTCEFITMCPSGDCEYLPSVDLNYMNPMYTSLLKEENNIKRKRKSQIDKFNQKYVMK